MLAFRFVSKSKFSFFILKNHSPSGRMSASTFNSSKANLCYTKYDKENLKIIGTHIIQTIF
jgi:hypothetical protein